MAYATLDDMRVMLGSSELINLTDRFGTGEDESQIAKALADGAAQIDAALSAAGFLVPAEPIEMYGDLNPLPRLQIDIARWILWSNSQREIDKTVADIRYKAAVAQLARYATGQDAPAFKRVASPHHGIAYASPCHRFTIDRGPMVPGHLLPYGLHRWK